MLYQQGGHMILKDWLLVHNITANEFSRMVGIAPASIYRSITNKRRICSKSAILIENATHGLVSRTEAIWPEDFIDVDDEGNRVMLKKPKRRDTHECTGYVA